MKDFGPRKYSFIEYVKQRIDAINKRFGYFANKSCEKRFWSIEITESIVAFKFNKNASHHISNPIQNNGIDDDSIDFRYEDKVNSSRFYLLKKIYQKFKFISFIKRFARYFLNKDRTWNFKAKEFFE